MDLALNNLKRVDMPLKQRNQTMNLSNVKFALPSVSIMKFFITKCVHFEISITECVQYKLFIFLITFDTIHFTCWL